MSENATIPNLSMHLRRCIAKLNKAAPGSNQARQATEYLVRVGLTGSPLRAKRPSVRFEGREITPAMAAQGYNNKGRGKLIGYISDPAKHAPSCAHRKSMNAYCTCPMGLWQEQKPSS